MLFFYDKMKDHAKKNWDRFMHWDKLFNILLTRFKYDGLPDNIPQGFVEGMLLCNGTVGFSKVNGELWAFPGAYCGSYHGYLPTEYMGVLPDISPKQGKIGDTWEVVWNNLTRTPELIVLQYADILSEIDVSERCNVRYARDMKIPKVGSERERQAVKDCINNIRNGNMDCVVSDNTMAVKQYIEGIKEDPLLELTDINDIDKLQYLNQYRDNIVKRFGQLYGFKSQVTSKLAQMSEDEVHSNDSLSLILSDEALQCRQEGLERVNSLFGTNITCEFNECWQDEVEEMWANNSEDVVDGDGDGVTNEEGDSNAEQREDADA